MRGDQLSTFMAEALRLASLARGRTSPNPMVGAVIVKGDKVIGKGYHHQAGTPHAEVHALNEAGEEAKGSTVYVTLEPCSHFGRTPPCAQALIRSGVRKVVIAMQDPNPLVSGRGIEQLRAAGIEVEIGDMEAEARTLNEVFIKHITTGLPFVVFKTAMSLDGKIATSGGESRWITGEETRQWTHSLRDRYDGIMVGINTILADNPALTCRVANGKDPVRLVVDSHLRLPLQSQVISSSLSSPLYVATTTAAPPGKLTALKNLGVHIFIYDYCRVPLKQFMQDIANQGVTGILLEGGATLAWSMLEENLIDKVHFCIAPKLIGGHNAPSPFGGAGVEHISQAFRLDNLAMETIGEDYVFTGYTHAC